MILHEYLDLWYMKAALSFSRPNSARPLLRGTGSGPEGGGGEADDGVHSRRGQPQAAEGKSLTQHEKYGDQVQFPREKCTFSYEDYIFWRTPS